jgi:hypothetical protein
MTNKEAMEIVLEAAAHSADILAPQNDREGKILAAVHQMQDYYNDVMEDDLIITQGDKKLKEMLED